MSDETFNISFTRYVVICKERYEQGLSVDFPYLAAVTHFRGQCVTCEDFFLHQKREPPEHLKGHKILIS